MTELLSFEKQSNPVLQLINGSFKAAQAFSKKKVPSDDETQFKQQQQALTVEAVVRGALDKNASLALPLSSTLMEGVTMDEYFLSSHFLLFDSALQFKSFSGDLSGCLNPARDKLTLDQSVSSTTSSSADLLVPLSVEAHHHHEQHQEEWLVLRETTLDVDGRAVIPLLLLSAPLPVTRSLPPSVTEAVAAAAGSGTAAGAAASSVTGSSPLSPRALQSRVSKKRLDVLSSLFGGSGLSPSKGESRGGLSFDQVMREQQRQGPASDQQQHQQQPPPSPDKPDNLAVEEARQFVAQTMASSPFAPFMDRCLAFVRAFTERYESGRMPSEKRKTFFCNFLSASLTSLVQVPPFDSASQAHHDALLDFVEDFVAEKLFPFLFRPSVDKEKNAALTKRMNQLAWIEPKHLDLSVSLSDNFMSHAKQCLAKLNHFRTPRLKLECILNLCKLIYSLFEQQAAGADDLLPLIIYITIRANPPLLHSNIVFISEFRSPAKLSLSESGYYFTQMLSAISFIENLTQTSLTVTEAEWARKMNLTGAPQTIDELLVDWKPEAQSAADQETGSAVTAAAGSSRLFDSDSPVPPPDPTPPSEQQRERFPFKDRSFDSLSPSELREMHEQYKLMAAELEAASAAADAKNSNKLIEL